MNWVEAFGAFRSRFRKMSEINGWMLVDVRFKRLRIACFWVYLYSLNSFEQVPTLPRILHVHHAGVLLYAVFSKLPLWDPPATPIIAVYYMGALGGLCGGFRVFISIWVMGRLHMDYLQGCNVRQISEKSPCGRAVRTVS